MRILLSGSTGFVGRPLFAFWQDEKGHEVVPLIRGEPREGCVSWDPERGLLAKEDFEGFDAVVHLAGEPIGSGRWTRAKKKRILFSRTVGTWLLSHVLAQTLQPPKTFISVSAVGYYGDAGDDVLDEMAPAGRGFLASVCCEWEKAAQSIGNRGARVVHPRFGHVLGPGGILGKMIPAYKWGLGGSFGSGNQWMSWIEQTDLIRALDHVLEDDSLEGPINFTSPFPVRQKEFASELASLLKRPCFFNIPAWLLRLVLGEMADEALLASTRAEPVKLLESGFSFAFPRINDSLRKALLPLN
ncbi:MAG: TIGR01777 family oxidoreductase [Verrucomicrobia bacterium]|nr:TIGR01777 family oxidoreductase [Verrucomicrobiota bacterium]